MRAGFGAVLTAAAMMFAAPVLAATGFDAPAGVVASAAGCSAENMLVGRSGTIGACDTGAAGGGGATDLDLRFVDPANPERQGATESFSILVDGGSRAMVTAYDASGRLLGVADRIDDGTGAGAQRLTLTGLGDIARVHISGAGPLRYDELRFAEVKTFSRLPEPATWAMLASGFLLMAAAIRRRIRLSEARFTERVRRIAAGDAG